MFGAQKNRQTRDRSDAVQLAVSMGQRLEQNEALQERIADAIAPGVARLVPVGAEHVPAASAVFALFPDLSTLKRLALAVREQRARRNDGYPVLVVGLAPDRLTEFGGWLVRAARDNEIHGLRLMVERDPNAIIDRLTDYLTPVYEPNVIAMPVATEVESTRYKYFFCLSPELRGLLAYLEELAKNNISRIYLLGGPGAGKTSLAYYFHLARGIGNFVTVNLAAEATADKAAMKSLLCGHVSGAFAGAGSRTGAFSHARDGVCFLDESHGISGTVMDVLMEALDSNQYLPYGASAKRTLDCAVVFASNRSWDALMASVNMDEHARLGAQIMHLPDLALRQEDLIAVLAATLDGMRARSTTWMAPSGLSAAAWQAVRQCPWRGNTRALIRVIETAFVSAATQRAALIEREAIEAALAVWEPEHHASHGLYTAGGR